ncbi:hypothetical protein N656DRAFT_773789, partial [Canariomyces notabilis]
MEGLAGAMWSLWNSVFFFLLPLPRPLFFPRLLFIFFVTPLLYVGSYPLYSPMFGRFTERHAIFTERGMKSSAPPGPLQIAWAGDYKAFSDEIPPVLTIKCRMLVRTV